MIWETTTASADETERLASMLAAEVAPPVTIGLVGGLGAGKTAFARGFVIGVDPAMGRWVTSPTYAVVNEYPTSPPIAHMDLYRLADADDLEGIGYHELDEGWRLVEWADRVPEALASADVVVAMARVGESRRTLRFEGTTDRGRAAVQALADAWSRT